MSDDSNLPVNGFKWVEKLSKFNEKFIKSYNENSDIGYFLETDVEYLKKLFNLHEDLSFLPERKKKKKKSKKAFLWYRRHKEICCSHKNFKTSAKSWFKTKKGTQSKSI